MDSKPITDAAVQEFCAAIEQVRQVLTAMGLAHSPQALIDGAAVLNAYRIRGQLTRIAAALESLSAARPSAAEGRA